MLRWKLNSPRADIELARYQQANTTVPVSSTQFTQKHMHIAWQSSSPELACTLCTHMYPKTRSFIQFGIYYVWALPKYIEFASVLASFYSSVSKFCSAVSP